VPLVSVVIPAHNREKYLAGAVESVLAQTYADFEIIVVDDGSEDGTLKVAEGCGRKDSRVRHLAHGQRKGAQAARNTGIHAAQGRWIAFLDSDDEWLPGSLEVRLKLAVTGKAQVVHSCGYLVTPGEAEPRKMKWIFKGAEDLERRGLPLQGPLYKDLLRDPGPMFQALLVSKEALARIDYLDESIRTYQEWDTTIRLAKYYKFVYAPQPTFFWNCRNPDSMSKNLSGSALGYIQVIEKHQWSILRYLGPKALASHYEMAHSLFREAGDEIHADRCWRWANVWWPFRPSVWLARARRLVKGQAEGVGTSQGDR
jgi:glycosyltransferase involved in cell wall biosynthesis